MTIFSPFLTVHNNTTHCFIDLFIFNLYRSLQGYICGHVNAGLSNELCGILKRMCDLTNITMSFQIIKMKRADKMSTPRHYYRHNIRLNNDGTSVPPAIFPFYEQWKPEEKQLSHFKHYERCKQTKVAECVCIRVWECVCLIFISLTKSFGSSHIKWQEKSAPGSECMRQQIN